MSEVIIISPHCDDEIIGNYEVLKNKNNRITIIYGSDTKLERRVEAITLENIFQISKLNYFKPQFLNHSYRKPPDFSFPILILKLIQNIGHGVLLENN